MQEVERGGEAIRGEREEGAKKGGDNKRKKRKREMM